MRKEIIEKTMKALRANGFLTEYFERKDEVRPYLEKVMEKGSSCSVGGSVTLSECGVLELLRNGSYTFYDRYAEGVDVEEVFHKSFSVDNYLASANAITENGELVLIDGRGNRVAAVIYGPRHVYLVASTDKIVGNIKEAFKRCRSVACPMNAKRLNKDTHCAKNGKCIVSAFSEDDFFNAGVRGCKNTICSDSVIMSRQTTRDRITVILVDESCGY